MVVGLRSPPRGFPCEGALEAVVTRSEVWPRLDRARVPSGIGHGGDPGSFQPMSATHEIVCQRRAPSPRHTPSRLFPHGSGATDSRGRSLGRSVRTRKQHCPLPSCRSGVSLTSPFRVAPRVCGTSRHSREARTVELRSGTPRERSLPGLALKTPFTLAPFSLAGRRVVRFQARQIGLADEVASEERRASAVFQPTLGCLSRGSDP